MVRLTSTLQLAHDIASSVQVAHQPEAEGKAPASFLINRYINN